MKTAMKTPGMKSAPGKNTTMSGGGMAKSVMGADDSMMGVKSVKVGESSTMWGGEGASSKPGCNDTYMQLQVDRNVNPSNEGYGG